MEPLPLCLKVFPPILLQVVTGKWFNATNSPLFTPGNHHGYRYISKISAQRLFERWWNSGKSQSKSMTDLHLESWDLWESLSIQRRGSGIIKWWVKRGMCFFTLRKKFSTFWDPIWFWPPNFFSLKSIGTNSV